MTPRPVSVEADQIALIRDPAEAPDEIAADTIAAVRAAAGRRRRGRRSAAPSPPSRHHHRARARWSRWAPDRALER
jgi:hypothetical protein